MSFKNKNVVVTGAAKGIGAACVNAFLAEGANVAMLDLSYKDPVKREGNKLFLHCDVSNQKQVMDCMSKIKAELGLIDVLVNNAGIQRYGTVTDTSVEQWDEVMNVNLKSLFLCSKYALPYMLEKGSGVVVNIASVQAFLSQDKVAAYTTAKSAILGLTRSIAIDYAPNIRCVAVCPGTIDTPMLRDSFALSPNPDLVLQECIDMHLANRIGKPEEVANLVLFLSSEKAAFITGQAFRIDGGLGIFIAGSKKD